MKFWKGRKKPPKKYTTEDVEAILAKPSTKRGFIFVISGVLILAALAVLIATEVVKPPSHQSEINKLKDNFVKVNAQVEAVPETKVIKDGVVQAQKLANEIASIQNRKEYTKADRGVWEKAMPNLIYTPWYGGSDKVQWKASMAYEATSSGDIPIVWVLRGEKGIYGFASASYDQAHNNFKNIKIGKTGLDTSNQTTDSAPIE